MRRHRSGDRRRRSGGATGAPLAAAAQAIEAAVHTVLADPRARTRDLGGTMATDEFGRRVAGEMTHG